MGFPIKSFSKTRALGSAEVVQGSEMEEGHYPPMKPFGESFVNSPGLYQPPTGRTFARQSMIVGDRATDAIASQKYDQE